jgi:hypothetical protein
MWYIDFAAALQHAEKRGEKSDMILFRDVSACQCRFGFFIKY